MPVGQPKPLARNLRRQYRSTAGREHLSDAMEAAPGDLEAQLRRILLLTRALVDNPHWREAVTDHPELQVRLSRMAAGALLLLNAGGAIAGKPDCSVQPLEEWVDASLALLEATFWILDLVDANNSNSSDSRAAQGDYANDTTTGS